MKAWHVFGDEPWESSFLIFAETAARARYLGCKAGLWDYGDYIDTHARRRKEYDNLFDCEKVIETNDDLPAGTNPFYKDEDY